MVVFVVVVVVGVVVVVVVGIIPHFSDQNKWERNEIRISDVTLGIWLKVITSVAELREICMHCTPSSVLSKLTFLHASGAGSEPWRCLSSSWLS